MTCLRLGPHWSPAVGGQVASLVVEDRSSLGSRHAWDCILMAWERALQLFSRLERPSNRDVARCISACCKESRWEESLELFEGYQQDVVIASSVISACGKASMWWVALDLLVGCLTARLQADSTFFNSFLSCASWRNGLQVLEMMGNHSISPDVFTFNSLLKAFGHRWELSMALQGLLPLELDLVGCNTLLRQLPWLMAIDLLAQMPGLRLEKDVGTE